MRIIEGRREGDEMRRGVDVELRNISDVEGRLLYMVG
jgi:hypothetical protein